MNGNISQNNKEDDPEVKELKAQLEFEWEQKNVEEIKTEPDDELHVSGVNTKKDGDENEREIYELSDDD